MNQLEQNAIRDALREIYDCRCLCVHESLADEQIEGALRIVNKHLAQAQQQNQQPPNQPNSGAATQ